MYNTVNRADMVWLQALHNINCCWGWVAAGCRQWLLAAVSLLWRGLENSLSTCPLYVCTVKGIPLLYNTLLVAYFEMKLSHFVMEGSDGLVCYAVYRTSRNITGWALLTQCCCTGFTWMLSHWRDSDCFVIIYFRPFLVLASWFLQKHCLIQQPLFLLWVCV